MRAPSAFVVAVLTACASSPADTPAPRERMVVLDEETRLRNESVVRADTVHAPVQATMAALVETYLTMEIPITDVDEAANRLETHDVRVRRIDGARMSRWLDCGTGISGQRADSYQVTVTLLSSVLPAGPSASRVVTDLDGNARPRDTSGSAVYCSSRGTLEARIVEEVRRRAEGGGR